MTQAIEAGDPAQDDRAFRRSLGQYPTGVSIITTLHDSAPIGMAVNSFAAVSLDPPLVLWSIRRQSASAAAFAESGFYAVNVLAADQIAVSQTFGVAKPDRFDCVRWHPGVHGAPLIDGAIAHLECRLETVQDGGDHLILIGRVERHARFPGEPLLFAQGQYGVANSYPALVADAAAESADTAFLRLLSAASHQLSSEFQQDRDALGASVPAARIVRQLRTGPQSAEALQQATLLGPDDLTEALASLAGKGELSISGGLWSLSDSGRKTADLLAGRAEAFAARKLDAISSADLNVTARVLAALNAS